MNLLLGGGEQDLPITPYYITNGIGVEPLTVEKKHCLLLEECADVIQLLGLNPSKPSIKMRVGDDAGDQLLHIGICLYLNCTSHSQLGECRADIGCAD